MSNAKVYQGQSFLDKVIELTGSVENAFEMALLNNMSVTDDVVIGQELKLTGVTLKSVVSIFNENKHPATAINEIVGKRIMAGGIGKMIIGKNFIIR